MTDLFDWQTKSDDQSPAPLAERLRATRIDDYIGQKHLLGPTAPLRRLIESDKIPSLILWGPPGCGKTTLANVIASHTKRKFHFFSAVLSGIQEARKLIEQAKEDFKYQKVSTILFIDEIHRFNKAQQDAFLPHIEKGTITLIGATTENPSFEVIGPLLSRCQVFALKPLESADLQALLHRALSDTEKGIGAQKLKIEAEAEKEMIAACQGDARRLLNFLENSAALVGKEKIITPQIVQEAVQKKILLYDKKGEEHYNVISTFIKSMRGSDPDAAIYWLARMLEAGEDPLFVARRMVIFASEDVGNADPQAIQVAIAAMQAYDFVGMPEGWIPLAQAATYLASAPKSNASYKAYLSAKEDLKTHGSLPTPLHLRNAPTKLMKEMDYGKGYQYAHNKEGLVPDQQHLPDLLKEKVYYHPTSNGYELKIREWLEKASNKKR